MTLMHCKKCGYDRFVAEDDEYGVSVYCGRCDTKLGYFIRAPEIDLDTPEMTEKYPRLVVKMHAFAMVNPKMVPVERQVITPAESQAFVVGDNTSESTGNTPASLLNMRDYAVERYTTLIESLANNAYKARQEHMKSLKEELE